jgi:hypothetical protein
MSKIGKAYTLFLILSMAILCVGLLTVKSANAQPISAPTFSIDTSTNSTFVPESYWIDPYHGNINVTFPSYTRTSLNITITIKNSPQTTAYNLQAKINYPPNYDPWHGFNPYNVTANWLDKIYNMTASASSGPQTIIIIYGSNSTGRPDEFGLNYRDTPSFCPDVPFGSQLDFRLQSVSGNNSSNWSQVQTIAITDSPTATVPEISVLLVVPLLLSLFSVAVVITYRKNRPKIPIKKGLIGFLTERLWGIKGKNDLLSAFNE